MAGRLLAFERPYIRRQCSGPWDLWSDPWSSDFPFPGRLLDQHFGQGLFEDDLLPPQQWRGLVVRPKRHPAQQASGVSEVRVPHCVPLFSSGSPKLTSGVTWNLIGAMGGGVVV